MLSHGAVHVVTADSLFYGEPVQLFKTRFSVFSFTNFRMSFGGRFANGTYASDFNVCNFTCFDDVFFVERSLLKMRPRKQKIQENSFSLLLREIVFGS